MAAVPDKAEESITMNPVKRGKTADPSEFSKSSFALASAATIDAFASSTPNTRQARPPAPL